MSRGRGTRRGGSVLTSALVLVLLVTLLLQAPVAAAEPTPTPAAPDPAASATPESAGPTVEATPVPTPTAEPTPPLEPPPTPTPAPPATEPAPSAEPQPTATPEPTPPPAEPAPSPPEPTPEPVTPDSTPETPPPAEPAVDTLVPPPPAAPMPTPSGLQPVAEDEPITEPPPASDPNLVVPAPFNASMTWSEEGGWHWVTISHDGTRRFWSYQYDVSQGKELPFPYFVATRVRTLQPSDPCGDCVILSDDELGPPSILGGPENPALAVAYANLENGPRRKIADDVDGGERWTYGSWYLNYSPLTGTFFSWTWIPEDWTLEAKAMGHVPNTAVIPLPPAPQLAGAGPLAPAQLLSRRGAAGGRVWPIAGAYRLTQAFGCVPQNDGYETASFCPPETPSFHNGVDLAAPAGTTIVAAASGTVTFAGTDSSTSGNSLIVIRHDGANAAFQTEYLHWQRALVQTGDVVQAGQPIAEVGSIGYSTGPHLHFVVKDVATGASMEPLQWLNGLPFDDTALTANVLRWQPEITAAAAAHNVPAALIAAIMTVESAGNPAAVSPAGAVGLMQIMPDQLTRLGVPRELWQDPAANIDAGARYLAETLDTGAPPEQAVAVYFGVGCDVLGTCTDAYVERVMQWFTFYTDQLR